MPERFELSYIGEDGKEHRPVMLHRVIYGAMERFMGILIEHYAGAFPVWLSPVQAIILPVSEKFNSYAQKISSLLSENNIRAEISDESESLGKRIRRAEKQKIPYMLVVGEKEEKEKKITIRSRGEKEQKTMQADKFMEKIIVEIKERS